MRETLARWLDLADDVKLDGLGHFAGVEHGGHDHVAQEDVGVEVARGFDGFLPAVDGSGLEAILVKDQSEGVGDDAFIIGDQHPGPDPVVRETRIHGTLGKNCIQTLGFVQRVYSP